MWKAHEDIAQIERVITAAIETESPDDPRVYTDVALAELCRRAGLSVSWRDMNYFRRRLGYPGTPMRLRQLIEEGQK